MVFLEASDHKINQRLQRACIGRLTNFDINTYPGYYKISEKERFAIHIIHSLFEKIFKGNFPIQFSKYSTVIQVIYKTYKTRKMLEENLNQLIIMYGFEIKDNYDDVLIEINKKIDLMYENLN